MVIIITQFTYQAKGELLGEVAEAATDALEAAAAKISSALAAASQAVSDAAASINSESSKAALMVSNASDKGCAKTRHVHLCFRRGRDHATTLEIIYKTKSLML